jgi:hypothetical protein
MPTPRPSRQREELHWQARGACAELDPDLCFPEDPDDPATAALAACGRCAVTAQCLAWAAGNVAGDTASDGREDAVQVDNSDGGTPVGRSTSRSTRVDVTSVEPVTELTAAAAAAEIAAATARASRALDDLADQASLDATAPAADAGAADGEDWEYLRARGEDTTDAADEFAIHDTTTDRDAAYDAAWDDTANSTAPDTLAAGDA